MRPSGQTYYMWPEDDDIYWEDMSTVLIVLGAPNVVNDRMQYEFLKDELDKAKTLL